VIILMLLPYERIYDGTGLAAGGGNKGAALWILDVIGDRKKIGRFCRFKYRREQRGWGEGGRKKNNKTGKVWRVGVG